jgi:PAS domain S-box-containing protein
MTDNDGAAVSAAEIIRNFGHWQAKALREPVVVTHHGRPRLMLVSVEAWEDRLKAPAAAEPQEESDADAVYPALLNHMTEGFVAYDHELNILAVNPAAEAFLERSSAELVGRHFSQAFPTAVRSITHERLQRVVRTGEAVHYEARSTVQPGRRIAVNAFPYRGGAGVVFVNTTDQERLGDNQDVYRALVDALEADAALAMGRLDARGRVLELQPQMADWLGMGEAELQGARLYDLVSPADRRRLLDAVEGVWEAHTPQTVEASFLRRNAEDMRLRLTFSAVLRDFTVQGVLMVAARAVGAAAFGERGRN